MTCKRYPAAHRAIAPLAALLLAGCLGPDENTIQSGLTMHLGEVHAEAKPGAAPLESSGIPNSAQVQGGYDQTLEHHVIADANGRLLSLYRAYVGLGGLELVPCPGIARLSSRLLDMLVPDAAAHAGHGSEPVGGRALDRPNVIDIVTQDEFVLPLGDAATAPGSYCGVRVAVVPVTADAYGKPDAAPASADDPITVPEVPELTDRIFSMRADYCAQVDGLGTCTHRVRVDVDDVGLAAPAVVSLDFGQPLDLHANRREVYAAIGIAYGEWVQDVDVSRLATDTAERQRLLDNIAGSLHVRYTGLGGLPINTGVP